MNQENTTSPGLKPVTPHAILSSKLEKLKHQLTNRGADASLLELVTECYDLAAPLDDYLLKSSSPPSAALNDLEKATNKMDWDAAFDKLDTSLPLEREMLSGAVEGQFLKMLTAVSKAKRVLEIGSFTGYASLAIAEALPPDGELIACEYDAYTAKFAQSQMQISEHGKKVKVIVGDAAKSIEKLAEQKVTFDLVFLDADKQNYHHYYSEVLNLGLVEIGGIICVDNTLYMGEAYRSGEITENGKAIAAFNKMVAEDNRVQQVMLPLRDGVTVIRRVS